MMHLFHLLYVRITLRTNFFFYYHALFLCNCTFWAKMQFVFLEKYILISHEHEEFFVTWFDYSENFQVKFPRCVPRPNFGDFFLFHSIFAQCLNGFQETETQALRVAPI